MGELGQRPPPTPPGQRRQEVELTRTWLGIQVLRSTEKAIQTLAKAGA